MRFRVLGSVAFERDGRWQEVRAPLRRRLLAVLLARAGRTVTLDTLVEALWSSDPPRRARKAVQLHALRLRRDLAEPARLLTRPTGLVLVVREGELDSQVYEELIRRAADARAAGASDEAMTLLDRAEAMWSARPYSGVDAEVVDAEVERLLQLRVRALEDRVAAGLDAGRHLELIPELSRLVPEHPFRERLTGFLMLALHRAGRTGEALEVFARTQARLAEELGVEPGRDLRDLRSRIAHGALDLTPPPRTSGRLVPEQLPADLPSFTGRETELRELSTLADVARDRTVVAVVHGMGGVGKTSLAVRAAHRLAENFPDGRIVLDMCGFTPNVDPVEPDAALERLLGMLGVAPEQIPSRTEDRAALWRTLVAGRRLLLLLDNVRSAEQIRPLVPGVPGSFVLATSRRALTALDDASFVELETLPADEAVTMLRRVVGDQGLAQEPPHLWDELADRCGGLPLALRLAAARWRIRNGGLTGLVAALADRQGRLQELEVPGRGVEPVLRLSYQELAPGPARLFRRLGLHPGLDFDVYAAAALLGTDAAEASRLLDELVDAHLVRVRNGRFTLHDLVRAMASTVLAEEEPQAERAAAFAALTRHYRHLASVASELVSARPRRDRSLRPAPPSTPPSEASPGPRLRTRADAVAALDAELANLITLAGHCADTSDPETTIHLASTLRGHLANGWRGHEALTLHGHAVRAAQAGDDRRALGRALVDFGFAHLMLERHADAERHLRSAVECLEDGGDLDDLARAHDFLARVTLASGRFLETIDHHRTALACYRRRDDSHGVLRALVGLAEVHNLLRDPASALEYEAEAEAALAGLGELPAADWFGTCAETHLLRDDRTSAARHAEQALVRYRALGGPLFVAKTLAILGRAYTGVDDAAARRCHERALALADELGHAGMRGDAALAYAESLLEWGEPEKALSPARDALKFASESGWPHDIARAHRRLGDCYDRLGRTDRAVGHWAEALRVFEALNTPDAQELRLLLSRQGTTGRR